FNKYLFIVVIFFRNMSALQVLNFGFFIMQLLLVSRVLKKLDMDAEYEGNVEATGCLGGLDIPHTEKRFAGYKKADDGKNAGLDAEINRKYIFGGHVGINMRSLMENEHEKFQTNFAMHAAVRGDPTTMKTEKEAPNGMPTRGKRLRALKSFGWLNFSYVRTLL
ncbi:hypothetical protein MKW94_008606, partial [Papaver nudicaule]|nr:hypothetical protein [Papaver nudicaule]